MRGLTVGSLLRLPVRFRGIQLGRPVDVILDPRSERAIGLDVLCGDDTHRFLPLAAAEVRDGEIAVSSALTLLTSAELDFYRDRGSTLRDREGGRELAFGNDWRTRREPGRGDRARRVAMERAFAWAGVALRARHNWVQLAKFLCVGASGYVVNLGVYSMLLNWANLHYAPAATGSFLVAASWNYALNRHWTFRAQRGHVGIQGMRFFIVSALVYAANLGVLALLVSAGFGKIVAQGCAILLVTPLNFLGNKLWSFRS